MISPSYPLPSPLVPLLSLFAYLSIGASIKFIDQAFDTITYNKRHAILLSIPLGFIMGYLIASDFVSTVLLLSLLLGVAVSKKIDNIAFRLLFCLSLITAITLNHVLILDRLPFIVLFLATVIDELMSDWSDSNKQQKNFKFLSTSAFFSYRLFLPSVAFILVLFANSSLFYLLYILAFDVGYKIVNRLSSYHSLVHSTSKKLRGSL